MLRALVVMLVLLAAGQAHADESPQVGLDLQGPAWLSSCLTQPALEAGVRARATGPLPDPLRVHITSTTDEDEPVQWIEIEVAADRGQLGSRKLEVQAADCEALPNAVALVVVLLAQSAEPAAQPPVATPVAPPRDEPPPQPVRVPVVPREPEPYWDAAVGAGVGVAVQVLPAAALGANVRGELNLQDAAVVALHGHFVVPQTRDFEEGTVSFAAYGLAADLCAGPSDRGVRGLTLRACAGPAAALVQASGSGFRLENRNEIKVLLAVAARVEGSVAIAPFTRLLLQAGGGVAVLRPRFLLHRQDQSALAVHTPGLFSASLAMNLMQMF